MKTIIIRTVQDVREYRRLLDSGEYLFVRFTDTEEISQLINHTTGEIHYAVQLERRVDQRICGA